MWEAADGTGGRRRESTTAAVVHPRRGAAGPVHHSRHVWYSTDKGYKDSPPLLLAAGPCCCCYRSLPVGGSLTSLTRDHPATVTPSLYVTDTVCVGHMYPAIALPQSCGLTPTIAWLYIHMSVTRWDVTPRNVSLGLQRLYSGFQLHFRISSVLLTSIHPLQREGTRGPPPSLLAPSKAYRLIDFYDVILMMGVPMLLGTSDR
jgi:hypothetical protein